MDKAGLQTLDDLLMQIQKTNSPLEMDALVWAVEQAARAYCDTRCDPHSRFYVCVQKMCDPEVESFTMWRAIVHHDQDRLNPGGIESAPQKTPNAALVNLLGMLAGAGQRLQAVKDTQMRLRAHQSLIEALSEAVSSAAKT